MIRLKLKNQKHLNPCTKCGLLTYNGKNSLCNVCDPPKKPIRAFERPTENALPKRRNVKAAKVEGRQLQKYSKAYGKTVKNIEYTTGSLVISFTDNTFLHIAGDNNGDGGYVHLLISKEQQEKNNHFKMYGYECETCHHQWLPRKNTDEPKRCPKCQKSRIISLFNLRFRQIEEQDREF